MTQRDTLADLIAAGYSAAEIRALRIEGHRAEQTRARADLALSCFVPGIVDVDTVACDPGDGRPYAGRDDASRFASEPDSRKGVQGSARDLVPHRDSGRPTVTGEARSVRMERHDSRPLATGNSSVDATLTAAREASARAVLASVEPGTLATIAARTDRLDSVTGVTCEGASELDRAARGIARGDWTHNGAPATAKLATDAIKASGLAARYALDTDVTGPLPHARMRVAPSAPNASGVVGSVGDHRTADREARASAADARSALVAACEDWRNAPSKARRACAHTIRGMLSRRPDLAPLAIRHGFRC